MRNITRFFQQLVAYRAYIIYSTKSNLKSEVSNTFLGYFWWVLDPILQMLVYTVLVGVIMKRGTPNFPVFVFCGMLSWKWFTSCTRFGTNCLRKNANIIKQIYLPKFIPPLVLVTTNLIKLFFGFIILLILITIYRIPFTWHMFEVFPVILVNFTFIFAVTVWFTHWGALFMDLKNLIGHLLQLWYYLSPGLYTLDRVPEQYRWLWWLNPMTTFFESYRNVFMYGKHPLYDKLGIWLGVSFIILVLGVAKLYQYDNNYSKVL